jgi:glycerophosphoryl diester phosphodiesterase
MPVSHPFFALPRPFAIGHRGCAGDVPENTLASFERGLADGAVVLETDVHLTRDGVPVLIHDDDVARVTDGSGPVRDFAFADLQRLDAGHRFTTPDGATPFRGAGHRIPSLAEALDALPDARFNLELKEDLPEIVARTLGVIREAKREAHTLVTAAADALNQRIRDTVAREESAVALGASAGDVARFAVATLRGEEPPAGPMAFQVPPVFAGQPLVTEAFVSAAHEHGMQVHVWTINDPGEIAALFDLGVDGVVSDHPARVVQVIAQRARP